MGFNLFGSSAENRNQTTSNNISGGAADEATSIVAQDSQIEIIDAGAVQSAFNFANTSQALFGDSFASVLGLAEKSIVSQGEFISKAADAKAVEETGGVSKIIPLVLITGIVGFVAIKVFD